MRCPLPLLVRGVFVTCERQDCGLWNAEKQECSINTHLASTSAMQKAMLQLRDAAEKLDNTASDMEDK